MRHDLAKSMIQDKIKNLIRGALENLKVEITQITLEHPSDIKMGDYSSNIAMACAKALNINPKELAEKIVVEINRLNTDKQIEKIEVAGPGFINFYLSRQFFTDSLDEIINNENFGSNNSLLGKKIMFEYTDPNPFKPLHIGHLMTNAIGESISRIAEYSGAEVYRANYQGDVGLHVARAIWGLMNNAHLQKDDDIPIKLKAANIGEAYALGSAQYEIDKTEIDILNKKIYDRSDELVNKIYDWGFKVTMEAFEDLYRMLGTKFDYYFLESEMADIGKSIVEKNMGKVFTESDGAIVFKAEVYDPKLHTRVFITSAGLPTYETKELGLTQEKFTIKPNMDLSIVVTATEQMDYMRVLEKAISLIYPLYANKMKHIIHGMMRFASGKMSSRKGNIVTGESLLNDARLAIVEKIADRNFTENEIEDISSAVAVSAIKYSILKQSTGGDIIYDFEKSISFEGDSGPYLQYSYARAHSIIEKAKNEKISASIQNVPDQIYEIEKLLYRFPEVVLRSSEEYGPHHIANYLIDLARSFNSFYGNNQIIDKENSESLYRVALTSAFATVMKNGIYLLGIKTPERM